MSDTVDPEKVEAKKVLLDLYEGESAENRSGAERMARFPRGQSRDGV